MRIVTTIIIILFSIRGYACECAPRSTMEKLESSDFVARVNINDIARDPVNQEYLNLDVEILNIFKGEFDKDLKILTNESMCNVNASKGSEWLVYASYDKNNQLSFGYCSGSIQLDKNFSSEKYPKAEENYRNSTDRKLDLLNFLNEKRVINESSPHIIQELPGECFDNLKGYKGKTGEFAVYEIWINEDLSVEKINQIKEFSDPKLNQKLDKCLNKISFQKSDQTGKIAFKYKKIIPIFFYEEEEENPSFVSLWDL